MIIFVGFWRSTWVGSGTHLRVAAHSLRSRVVQNIHVLEMNNRWCNLFSYMRRNVAQCESKKRKERLQQKWDGCGRSQGVQVKWNVQWKIQTIIPYPNNPARKCRLANTPTVWTYRENASWSNSAQCTACRISRKRRNDRPPLLSSRQI